MRTGRNGEAAAGALGLAPLDPESPEKVRELAHRLRQVLAQAGFTGVREIAASCTLSRTTVSDALAGNRGPTWNTVAALLELCQVPRTTSWRRLQEEAKAAERSQKSERRGRAGATGIASRPVGSDSTTAPVRETGAPLPGTFSIRAPFGELPPQVRGRGDLLAALGRELAGSGGRVQVLHGLGGCGKTTVALQLARIAHDRGYRVFWVSAGSRERLTSGMRQVASELGVPEESIEAAWSGRSSATDLVWRALDGAGGPWLLVVDNLDEPSVAASEEGAVGDGTGWIRASPAGLTVVTTRIGNPMVWGAQATCRPVDALSPEDGATVLVDFAGAAGPEADARRLSEQLGGLPLALRLAGSYLARARKGVGLLRGAGGERGGVRDFAGYTRVLDRLGAQLLDQGEPRGSSAGERRLRRLVSHTWEMSLDLLAEQGITEARLLMRLLSCFGRAPFPVEVLRQALDKDSSLFSGSAERCEAALEALVDVSLLSVEEVKILVDSETSTHTVLPCLTAHPLVLETNALQIRNAAEPTRVQLWRGAAVLAAQLARVSDKPGMWKVWQLLVPHVRAGVRDVPESPEELLATFLEAGLSARRYALASNSRALAEELTTLLIERADALPEGHSVRLAAWRAYHDEADDTDRAEAARELYETHLRHWGADHETTLAARLMWAKALRDGGRVSEAEREFRAVSTAVHQMAGISSEALVAHAFLVHLLADQGRTEEAANEARGLMAAFGAWQNGADVSLAHHVAHALDAADLLADAEAQYRGILAELEKAAEEDSPLYRDMARHLAENLARQNRVREAIDVFGELLDRYRADPETVAGRLDALVRLYDKRVDLQLTSGEADRAESELRSFLADDLASLDTADENVVHTRLTLVSVLLVQQRPTEAGRELDAVEAALATRGAEAVSAHWPTRLWRARWHCARGSCTEAVDVYDEVIEVLADKPDLARTVIDEAAACRQASGRTGV